MNNYLPDSIYTICGEYTQDCGNCSNMVWSNVVQGYVHDSQRGKVFCPFGTKGTMNIPINGQQGLINVDNLRNIPNFANTTWGRVPQLSPRPLTKIGLEFRTG
jgi:hypothetical protein